MGFKKSPQKMMMPMAKLKLCRSEKEELIYLGMFALNQTRTAAEQGDGRLNRFPTPETRARMGTSFRRHDFWDRLSGQALLMIG